MEETTVQESRPSLLGNVASVTVIHKLDTEGLMMRVLLVAAIYAGFEILKLIIANAINK